MKLLRHFPYYPSGWFRLIFNINHTISFLQLFIFTKCTKLFPLTFIKRRTSSIHSSPYYFQILGTSVFRRSRSVFLNYFHCQFPTIFFWHLFYNFICVQIFISNAILVPFCILITSRQSRWLVWWWIIRVHLGKLNGLFYTMGDSDTHTST